MHHAPTTLNGELRLRSRQTYGQSRLVDTFRTAPFHISSSLDRSGDGRCEVIIQGVGPGHLPGDRVEIDLTADAGSILIVRGQGANRIFSSMDGQTGVAEVTLNATEGGTLVYLPGELIPYRNAMLQQTTEVRVDASSRAIVAEVITAGRVGLGEHFCFRQLDLRTRIWFADRLILQERYRLEPALRPLDSIARIGQHHVVATLNLIGDGWTRPNSMRFRGVEWAAGQTDHLITVRVFGDTAQHVNRAIREVIGAAGQTLESPTDYGDRTTALHCEEQYSVMHERLRPA